MGRKLTPLFTVGVVLALVTAACAPAAAPSSAPATSAAAAATAAAATSAAPSEPIRIGAITSLSANFAPWGVKIRAGMAYAAAEINAAGGVNGRKIEIVERDDKNNPNGAVTDFRDLIENQKVVAAGGVVSSDVALAVAKVAEETKTPLFTSLAGTDDLLTKASRYTFRTCLLAASMDMAPYAAFIKDKKFTKVGALIADYAWGHSIEAAIKKDIQTLPGVTVQFETAPVPEKDFTPYIRRLQQFGAEVLILTGHPPGNFGAAKVALDLGVGQYMFGSWSPPEAWAQQSGKAVYGKMVEGSCADWASPDYQKLAKSFYDSQKTFFDHSAFSGYVIVKLVADAIKRTGSTDRTKIADAVRAGTFVQPGYAYPLSYTDWGELKAATPIIYTIKDGDPPGGINPGAGWQPDVLLRSPVVPPLTPTK
jgi:branched-chain amino acid transport system substrate-binding protein